MKKYQSLVFLLFCLFSSNVLAAEHYPTKFNFDDDYQGEDMVGNQQDNFVYDPLEVVNRPIFGFNELFDKYLALPVARTYHDYVPDLIRKPVHNFVTNIATPFSVVNSMLQGDGTNSMASFSAFLINTTVGVGGLFDVAGSKKITYNAEDLGQTLGKYGIGNGPYLVIPLLGPSNLRDFSGFVVQTAVDPLSFNALEIGGKKDLIDDDLSVSLAAFKALDSRDALIDIVDDIRKDSFDVYATIRSAYLQKRESLINQESSINQ